MFGTAKRESPFDRRHFIGGSDARIVMGEDEKALIRLWQEKPGEVGPEDLSGGRDGRVLGPYVPPRAHYGSECFLLDFRNRTPAPPPFSSMNSMPAASIASLSRTRTSSDTLGPKPPSRRLTVGSERPAREASWV
jgi:hypothetical protein